MSLGLLLGAEALGVELFRVGVVLRVHVDPQHVDVHLVPGLDPDLRPRDGVVGDAAAGDGPEGRVAPEGLADHHGEVGEGLDGVVVGDLAVVGGDRLVDL